MRTGRVVAAVVGGIRSIIAATVGGIGNIITATVRDFGGRRFGRGSFFLFVKLKSFP